MNAMKIKTNFLILGALASLLVWNTVDAQYYFGRNKIQYDAFEWKILRTTHFDVYFYPEMDELAHVGAAMAEQAYNRLQGTLNHNVNRRIPLIFYSNHSHFEQTNTTPGFLPEGIGGFFEFLKGRVVIPADGSIHKFKHVINHELVHVFQHSLMNRILKDHRTTAFHGMPLWFTEGLAEYWSEGWDSQADMVIRDAVMSGYLVPLSRMDTIYGSFLMYKEGQAILKYIAENYGDEKILQLIQNIWKSDHFSEVMKLTIGLNYKEFDEKWIYDLKKLYYPTLKDGDSPKMVTKRITHDGINTKAVSYREGDSLWSVFVSNRMGYSNIYRKQLNGGSGKVDVLVNGERTSDFESFHLLSSKIDVNDEGHLTFISRSGPKDVLYVFDIASKKVLKKFYFKSLVTLSSPSWSPDSKQIVFSGISFSGLSDLYVVNVETRKLDRLTNDFYEDRDPAWSPDGKSVAFSSDRTFFGKSGFLNLFLYTLEDGKIHYLTEGPHNDYAPEWSPDGEKIAFSSDRGGSFNIWLIKHNPMGPGNQQLTDMFVASINNEKVGQELSRFKNQEQRSPENVPLSFPSALKGTDELKRVTNFTTAALDPSWIDKDRILFTAFENFSFQIREMDQVEKKFTDAPTVAHDTLFTSNSYWAADKIAGDVQTTTLNYKKKFSLDIAQSSISQDPVFGAVGGAQLGISDMLGNQQYYFLLYNNGQTRGEFLKSWNVAITKVELSKRINYAYGGYRITGRFYDRVESFFDQSRVGGFVSASYPLSVFKRIEAEINVRKERRTYLDREINGILITNSLSYVKDNSLWGITGPIDGERMKFTVGHTIDVQHNEVGFYTFIADYRHYFRLSRRTTFATRVMGRFNVGKEAFRYFMGGSWDLRLYPRWRIWGRKLFLINQELRFPFLDRFIIGFPFGGMGFHGIQGAIFTDLGQAWDHDYQFNEVLGSVGVGWRIRLGGFLVLRYEIGRRFQVSDLNSPNIHFEPGLKKAFWFGFDF